MCWACDNPDRPDSEYFDHLRGLIRQYGWAVQTVEGEGLHPPWAYTIGLTEHDAPELVVSGMEPREAGALLNDMACHLLHSSGFEVGEQLQLEAGPLLEVVAVAQPAVHLIFAVELCGPFIRAQQLVHADERGGWPWDRGYRGNQRVLGPRGPS
ncbi:DUF4262 domain-containing protein [Lentzea tibetensis]|uniref:DUF4262 domain-containing protein n=1 Tax=Lentzea tibetensis TaxID=2591470 RepID=A0A563F0Z1_9PSEU|nr:DUF4262 domain-containing protein [Lentzea tibetensis]